MRLLWILITFAESSLMSHVYFSIRPLLWQWIMLLSLSLIASDAVAKPKPPKENVQPQALAYTYISAPVWKPLLDRLAAEGQDRAALDQLFTTLPAHMTPAPMGRKILELYRSKFMPPKPDGSAPKPRPKYYKGTVTQANAEKCKDFLEKHAVAFAAAEEKFSVPSRVAVALLFVETRLGANVGKESALYSLASMALSVSPDMLGPWLGKLPEDYQAHLSWMREIMPKRAEWAYTELRALTAHILRDKIDPRVMPGSIYGAIGMCQFMPSNVTAYGADGDNDGIVDLFNPADAIASLSRYLHEHGWKAGITREQQHAVLRTYNKSDTYAATILALSDVIAGDPVPADAE